MDNLNQLDAVYYGTPIPSTVLSLSFLALVFDRIHFPNVYIPLDGYDPEIVKKETDRIEALGCKHIEDAIMLGVLRFLPFAGVLKDVCYFTGQRDDAFGGCLEQGTQQLVEKLDVQIHGPPPPGFTPVFEKGTTKGLPECNEAIHYPGFLHYPANALLYASRHGIPLINDSPYLPVLPLSGGEAKNNAALLSSVMALQCVAFALPKLRALTPAEIIEFRAENRQYLIPFRRSVLRLSKDLNSAISAYSTPVDIQEAAKFIVDTEVLPQLHELKNAIEQKSGRWYERAFDLAKQSPEIVSAFCEVSLESAIAKILTACGGVLIDIKKERDAKDQLARSGMYYLLQVKKLGAGA